MATFVAVRGKQVGAMSWWNRPFSKIANAIAPRAHDVPERLPDGGLSPGARSGQFSPVKPPPRRESKQKPVPTELRAAMATLKTGDFIFDPTDGR